MRKTLATLALVTLAMLTGVTANAADEPWPTYPCLSGGLRAAESTATVVPDLQPFVMVKVPGSMNCDVPDPNARFGVGMWERDGLGTITTESIRPYTTPTGPTTFTVERYVAENGGLCLMPNAKYKISCVRVLRVNGVPTIVQVSPKDKFFAGSVELVDEQTTPGCPSCW